MQVRHFFWFGVIAAGCFVALTVWMANSMRFVYKHWQAPDKTFVFEGDQLILPGAQSRSAPSTVAVTQAAAGREMQGGVARAVVDHRVHDFGRMDPLTMDAHTFLVRNEGTGPLELTHGPTSCKCTLSHVDREQIPPGGVGEVRLEWNSGKAPTFSHTATVFTNDPQNKELDFRVEGTVRMLLGVDPPGVLVPEVRRDGPTTEDVVLYSQVWDSFSVAEANSSLQDLTWRTEPLDPATLREHDARSGIRLSISIPPGLKMGDFQEWLHLQIDGRGPSAQRKSYDLAVAGSVPGRLSVMGARLDGQDGSLRLGVLNRGQGAQTKLTIKVRDEQPELNLEEVIADPSFVRATLTLKGAPGSGLYSLAVEVPPDAPVGSHLGVQRGSLQLKFDHPRIPELKLQIEFAVVDLPERR